MRLIRTLLLTPNLSVFSPQFVFDVIHVHKVMMNNYNNATSEHSFSFGKLVGYVPEDVQ